MVAGGGAQLFIKAQLRTLYCAENIILLALPCELLCLRFAPLKHGCHGK